MLQHFHSNFFKWNTVYHKGQVCSFSLSTTTTLNFVIVHLPWTIFHVRFVAIFLRTKIFHVILPAVFLPHTIPYYRSIDTLVICIAYSNTSKLLSKGNHCTISALSTLLHLFLQKERNKPNGIRCIFSISLYLKM